MEQHMEQRKQPFWYDSAVQFLAEYAPGVTANEIVAQVKAGAIRWTTPLSDGRELWLIRLSNPVVERDEVFLGNILFNDWLNKSLKIVVESAGLGVVYPLMNNLDTAYFLVVTGAMLEAIASAYRAHLLATLPSLFFSDDDSQQGIHGNLHNMFTFLKSDFEPFPVFAVPSFLAEPLEKRVRAILRELIEKPYLIVDEKKGVRKPTTELRTLQATMAFFYGRTSGGAGDCQSHPTFVARMVTEYGLLTAADLRKAFRLTEEECPDGADQRAYKLSIQQAIANGTFNEDKTRELFRNALKAFTTAIDNETSGTSTEASWFLPYLRQKGKFVGLSPEEYLDTLLHIVTLGEQALGLTLAKGDRCRVCGDQTAVVEEKNILLGISVGKFYNRIVNQPKKHINRLCVRCALYAYLSVKQLRSTTSGKFPIPRKGNLIFHYGPHSSHEIEVIGHRINVLIKIIRKKNQIRAEHLVKSKKQAKEERQAWTLADEQQALVASLQEQAERGEVNQEDLVRLQQLTQMMPPAVEQTLSNAGSAHVLDIGLGDWRLMAFAVEHLRDEDEVVQKRFVQDRLTVFTLMSFLQEICGCHGPYYFQSPPRLAADRADAQPGTFYVRDRPIDAEQQRRWYRAASSFAYKVIGGFGRAALRDRIRLSLQLEQRPLETFSDVLRDSPFSVTTDLREAKYQVPLTKSDKIEVDAAGVRNGWEYLRAYEVLRQMAQEGATEYDADATTNT